MKLTRDEVNEAVTHGPFEAAVAPMDAAVRALEFRGDVMHALPGFGGTIVIGGDGRDFAHTIHPRAHAWQIAHVDFHRAGERRMADRGEVGEADRAAEVVAVT